MLAERDRKILIGLQAMGFKWIAHDEGDEYDTAYTDKPVPSESRDGMMWDLANRNDEYLVVFNLNVCKPTDAPVSIEEILSASDTETTDKKWYLAGTRAEGRSYFAVELSNKELNAVKKFVDASGDYFEDEGWSGSFWIDDTPCETKEAVREHYVNKYIY